MELGPLSGTEWSISAQGETETGSFVPHMVWESLEVSEQRGAIISVIGSALLAVWQVDWKGSGLNTGPPVKGAFAVF